jgi:glycosyltransferase involved in cell wall biosynthesis
MKSDSKKNQRMLFLAYWFPPVQAIASIRTFNIAKYLSRRGWRITVVTPSPDCWRLVDNDGRAEDLGAHEHVRRVFTSHRLRFLSAEYLKCWDRGLGYLFGGTARSIARGLDIEKQVGWLGEARKACDRFQPGEFDIILASGGPFVSFQLAKDLSIRLGCPFVLDYRDLWTGNPHQHRPNRWSTVHRESAIFSSCAAAIAVSPSLKEHLSRRFNGAEKLVVLPNGYDADELQSVKPFEFGHFAIVYAGGFYVPTSTATPIMAALKILKDSTTEESANWRFHYYGTQGRYVSEEAEKYGVLERVSIHGMVPRQSVLSALRGANVAVVITSVNAESTLEEKGIMTGKIYEPLGLGTPILLIAPPDNDATGVVEGTGVGQQFHGGEAERIADFLRELMSHKTRRAKVPDRYSWKHIAEEMDRALLNALGRR